MQRPPKKAGVFLLFANFCLIASGSVVQTRICRLHFNMRVLKVCR